MWPYLGSAEGQYPLPDLLAMLFLMHSRIPLALLASRTFCQLMVNLSSTSTPRSFSTELVSCRSVPICFGTWGYSSQGSGAVVALVEPPWVSPCPTFQPVKFHLNDITASKWISQIPSFKTEAKKAFTNSALSVSLIIRSPT